MRRLTLLLAFCAILIPGCKKSGPVQYVEEGVSQLSSAVNVSDPKAAVQLLRGFHDIEQNAWRWTAGKFSVALRAPAGASASGAKLFVQFTLPEAILAKIPSTTLTATISGKQLEPQTFDKPGEHRYEREVPASLLQGEVINIDFALDKYLEAGVADQRELGVIVTVIGFQPPQAAPAAPAK
jgi:hypothetical protein